MMPSCDHTGTLHFHSSVTSGSASLISWRIRVSVSPRQSPSCAIRSEMSCDADFIRRFSAAKYRAHVLRGQNVVYPAKRSLLAHGERGVAHRGKREASECAADADPPHAGLFELTQCEARIGESHHDVHRL